MSATTAALIQAGAASLVVGVIGAFIAYVLDIHGTIGAVIVALLILAVGVALLPLTLRLLYVAYMPARKPRKRKGAHRVAIA